jgi:hypothetical protein
MMSTFVTTSYTNLLICNYIHAWTFVILLRNPLLQTQTLCCIKQKEHWEQDNVSEWSDMFTHVLLLQIANTACIMAKRKDKMSKNDPQNITQETRDWTTRTPLTMVKLILWDRTPYCSEMVRSCKFFSHVSELIVPAMPWCAILLSPQCAPYRLLSLMKKRT